MEISSAQPADLCYNIGIKIGLWILTTKTFSFIFMGSNYEYADLEVADYAKYIAWPSVIGYWSDASNYFSQPWEYLADLFGEVDRNWYTYTADAHENAIIYWENITNK